MKKTKSKFINTTDHEITDEKGYVYHSLNYNPGISSLHAEDEYYTLYKEGFQPIEIRKMFGVWEGLAYRSPHTGDERWVKYDMVLFPEEVIREHIRLYSKKRE